MIDLAESSGDQKFSITSRVVSAIWTTQAGTAFDQEGKQNLRQQTLRERLVIVEQRMQPNQSLIHHTDFK